MGPCKQTQWLNDFQSQGAFIGNYGRRMGGCYEIRFRGAIPLEHDSWGVKRL